MSYASEIPSEERGRCMKRLVFCIGLGLCLEPGIAAPAYAQDQKPAAEKPAAKKSSKKPALAKKSRRQEDARHCLTQPTNTEIIRCAEAYL
jgi:hypothetical protein